MCVCIIRVERPRRGETYSVHFYLYLYYYRLFPDVHESCVSKIKGFDKAWLRTRIQSYNEVDTLKNENVDLND